MTGSTALTGDGAIYRLGCDVGGTFTDFVLMNRDTGTYEVHKVLTTHDDPSRGIAQGAAELERRRPGAASGTEYIIHGTTLVINAILKRRGAPTAILTTEGFADILAIRREIRYDIYDLDSDYPTPLIEKSLRREVAERITSDGAVLVPLDEAQVKDTLGDLVARGIRSVAVCFLHSYVNPAHEEAVARIASDHYPELLVSLSSRVLREVREFERTSTTAINAYVRPLIAPYLNRLENQFASNGYSKRVYMMLSGGGIIAPNAAMEFPVRMVESGPVGGALAGAHLAEKAGIKDLIIFDIGGTTAKTTLLRDGRLAITTEYEVDRVHRFKKGSGTPIAVPCIDLIEIGTGGGSIAGVNKLGLLQVGPLSAESSPGPACYGLGGEQPTVTDANLLLGYLDGSGFMGGEMSLDAEAAAKYIGKNVGEKLDLTEIEAAWAIHDVANESMASSIRMFLAEKGVDPSQTALLAFGGGGPLHASSVARKLGVKRVIVPRAAGVFSAQGFLVAPVAYQVSRSQVSELDAVDLDDLKELFAELAQEASREVRQVVEHSPVELLHEIDICYSGQGSTVRVNADGLTSIDDLRARFTSAYSLLYGHAYEDLPLQMITVRVTASSDQEAPNIDRFFSKGELPPASRRTAFSPIRNAYVDYAVYNIDSMVAGAIIEGPTLIEDKSSTLVAHEDSRVVVSENGWLEIQLKESDNV
jgi:N-methylhydantoinase A